MKESTLLVGEREVVVPGQKLAEGMEFLPSTGTYRRKENIIAEQLGLVKVDGKILKIIPLSGKYIPKRNDVVIGKVIDILLNGWRVDMNSPYTAVLPLKDASFDFIKKGEDLSRYFDIGDYLVLKITNVTSQNLVDVTIKGPGLRKLKEGLIIYVNTYKVPRIIGKKGSMVSMIKKATGCSIIVGQNGIVWIQGEPKMEVIAVEAIKNIEKEAHLSGVTDRIKEFLEKSTGKKIDVEEITEKGENNTEGNMEGD